MDLTLQTLIFAFGLGLLGFVEPCTIGAHMLFLDGQTRRPVADRFKAAMAFLAARLVIMGGIGGLIVVLGQQLIGVQTSFWLVFGGIYLALGLATVFGAEKLLRTRIRMTPDTWRAATNPVLQGVAFGFNIPACAAPILFGLIGASAVAGATMTGFVLMSVFALALSLPLLPLSIAPRLARPLDRFAAWLRPRRWLLGSILIALGLWSLYFGLFVDPADWSGA